MKKLTIKINGLEILIGTLSSVMPSSADRALRMLRLNCLEPDKEADVFIFEFKDGNWILVPELSFVQLETPSELLNAYQSLESNPIELDSFIEILFRAYYWKNYLRAAIPSANAKHLSRFEAFVRSVLKFILLSVKRLKYHFFSFFKNLRSCP